MRKRLFYTITCLYICQRVVIAQDTVHVKIPQTRDPQISKPFNNNLNLIIGFDKLSPDTCITTYKNKKTVPQNCYGNIFVYNAVHKDEYEKWKTENYPEEKIIRIELNYLDDIKSGKLKVQSGFADPMLMDQFGKMKSHAILPPRGYEK